MEARDERIADAVRIKGRHDAAREAKANAPVSLDALKAPASSSTSRPNRRFINSTMTAVASHNRRVEEDECWNAKSMTDERLDRASRPSSVATFQYEHSHYETTDSHATSAPAGPMADQRAYWAARKAEQRPELAAPDPDRSAAASKPALWQESSDESDERDDARHRKREKKERKDKKAKKEKKHKKEKKKKKKDKHERERAESPDPKRARID